MILRQLSNISNIETRVLMSNSSLLAYDVDDFPYSIPINPAEPVKMVVEESAHYTLNAFPRGDSEWHYLIPRGGGTFRLGPQNRAFSVSMFHQLHCLRYFRNDYLNYTEEVNLNHVQHCFNYLRQTSLCHADLTLEPGDFTTRHFQHDRVGATHICRNWKAAYEEIELNWATWKKDREAIGIVAGTEGQFHARMQGVVARLKILFHFFVIDCRMIAIVCKFVRQKAPCCLIP